MLIRIVADTYVQEILPLSNFTTQNFMRVSGAVANQQQSFLYFAQPFPAGATILSAELHLYTRTTADWVGSNQLKARRVTSYWAARLLRYSTRPTTTAVNEAVVTVVSPVNGTAVTFDITDLMQDVADGAGTFWGIRLATTKLTPISFSSSESGSFTRPYVVITWSMPPSAPDQLRPDAQLVSNDSPRLFWQFVDRDLGGRQSASQVQIASDSGFASIVHDSGKKTNLSASWALSDDVFWDGADLPDGTSLYWRVRVWDDTDLISPWSATALFTRDNMGTLALADPGGTVNDTSPTFTWTLTGETQSAFRVALQRKKTDGSYEELWSHLEASTENEVALPNGYITTGPTYRVVLDVYDSKNRAFADHVTDMTDDFVYVTAGTPTAPSTLTAVVVDDSPGVLLTWTRASTPDYWCLKVDGVEVLDRIDVGDTFVSGTTYSMEYWSASPRDDHTYEIEAVVSTGGGPFEHSDANPTVVLATNPVGIWLADATDGLAIQILGREDVPMDISESASTYEVIGSKTPVRITDIVRGYAGSASGTLLGTDARDDFLELKGRLRELHLVFGDLNIPVMMGKASVRPTPHPGDQLYNVGFEFFQTGPPWPVDNV